MNTQTGVLNGFPTAAYNYTFTVYASDSEATPESGTVSVTLQVLGFTTATTLPTAGATSTAYATTFTAAGGSGTYSYSIAQSQPAGRRFERSRFVRHAHRRRQLQLRRTGIGWHRSRRVIHLHSQRHRSGDSAQSQRRRVDLWRNRKRLPASPHRLRRHSALYLDYHRRSASSRTDSGQFDRLDLGHALRGPQRHVYRSGRRQHQYQSLRDLHAGRHESVPDADWPSLRRRNRRYQLSRTGAHRFRWYGALHVCPRLRFPAARSHAGERPDRRHTNNRRQL